MVYFFSLTASAQRVEDYIEGNATEPIVLVEATSEIWKDYQENETSDWWPVTRYGHPDEVPEFGTREEAENEYAAAEQFTIYCRMHNC